MASSFLSDFFPKRFVRRFFPRHIAAPPARMAHFHLRNIYIVPTLSGLGLLGVMLLALIAAINFQNSMIYMVCFWLGSLLVINILYTFRNLSGLRIALQGVDPCFAGQNCRVRLLASSHHRKEAIYTGWKAHDLAEIELTHAQSCEVTVSYPAPTRGYLKPPRLDVLTRYPTGLTVAWAYARLDIKAIVYPKPELMGTHSRAKQSSVEAEDGRELKNGVDDFSGMQRYQAGDSLHRVHWAKYAQTRTLYTKNFVDYQHHDLWLNWDDLPSGSVEQRLSHLCARVLALSAEAQTYGLKIPGKIIETGNGDAQRKLCLTALALFSPQK